MGMNTTERIIIKAASLANITFFIDLMIGLSVVGKPDVILLPISFAVHSVYHVVDSIVQLTMD